MEDKKEGKHKREEIKKNQFISLLDNILTQFPQKTLSNLIYGYYFNIQFDGTTVYFTRPIIKIEEYVAKAPFVKVSDYVVETRRFTNPWNIVPVLVPTRDYKIMFHFHANKDLHAFMNIYFLTLIETNLPFVLLDDISCDLNQSLVHTCLQSGFRVIVISEKNIVHTVCITKDKMISAIYSYRAPSGVTLAIGLGYEEQIISIENLFGISDPFWIDLDKAIAASPVQSMPSLGDYRDFSIEQNIDD
jgi:hypothetical protein